MSTDAFNRADGPPGTSDSGHEWFIFSDTAVIEDGRLKVVGVGDLFGGDVGLFFPSVGSPMSGTFEFECASAANTNSLFLFGTAAIDFAVSPSAGFAIYSAGSGGSPQTHLPFTVIPGQKYNVRVLYTQGTPDNIKVKIWEEPGTEPAAWMVDHDDDSPGGTFIAEGFSVLALNGNGALYVDNLDITGAQQPRNCGGCPPFVSASIIDDFERVVSNAWGTPSRGAPDWVDYDETVSDSSTTQIGVSEIGDSTGWGRIILTLTKPSSTPARGASRTMQLEVDEIVDFDEFSLAFDMAVSPDVLHDGIAQANIRLGGAGDVPTLPMLNLGFQFEHPTLFGVPSGNHLDWITSFDKLADDDNARNDLIANVSSFDGTVTIDRSVSRGSTLVTVGALGTFEFTPVTTAAFGGAEKKLYVTYSDATGEATSNATSTCSIDNIRLVRGSGAAEPMKNQPVQDEFVAIGDGSTTAYAVDWPYRAASLQVEVAGMLSDVDPSDPATGDFELTDPAPAGARITATYRAKGT